MSNENWKQNRQPVRVYLAGDSTDWRRGLIAEASKNLYSSYADRLEWPTLPGVLPYQHDLVGPYNYADPEKEAFQRAHSKDDLAHEKLILQAIRRCDAVFVWTVLASDLVDVSLEIGFAAALGKYIVLTGANLENLQASHLRRCAVSKIGAAAVSPSKAYEIFMADVDVLHIDREATLASKYDGRCKGCGGSYRTGETISWSRSKGAYHPDCAKKLKDPKGVNAAMFHEGLTESLRIDNARLEKENTDQMVKISMLEQELEQLRNP